MADSIVGIDATRLLLTEPSFERPQDAVAVDSEVVAGGGTFIELDPLSGVPVWRGSFPFKMKTWAEIKAFADSIKFFMGVRSFWIPSWLSDFVLIQNASNGATALRVRPANFDRIEGLYNAPIGQPNPLRFGVFIISTTGTRFVRGIRDFNVIDASTHEIILHDAMTEALATNQVQLFSLMRRVKFTQEAFTIDYQNSAVASCSAAVGQVPFAGEDFRI